MVVLGTQDKNAFTDEYLAQAGYTDGQVNNVFKAQAYQALSPQPVLTIRTVPIMTGRM